MKEKSYVFFRQEDHDGKTKYWSVHSRKDASDLGRVSWFSAWRRYVFSPAAWTVYDANCLREIADLVETATKDHKS